MRGTRDQGIRMRRFAITVDVEEDLPGIVRHGEAGLDRGMPALMRLLGDMGVKADLFFLASVARSHPDLVNEARKEGHYIGNHGLDHRLLGSRSGRAQRAGIIASTRILEEVSGARPRMFRAPNFSANRTTFRVLHDAGYRVDSSVLPGRHLRRFGFLPVYDHRRSPPGPHVVSDNGRGPVGALLEVPVTANPLRPGAPLGAGAVHFFGVTAMLDALNQVSSSDIVFLVHPWELVDLGAHYPFVPEGYIRSSADGATKLGQFLDRVRTRFRLTNLQELASGYELA